MYNRRITTDTILWGSGIILVLSLIAGWKILKKAGESPWKILIPVYGGYCLDKVANSQGIFWGMLMVSIVSGFITNAVTSSIVSNKLFVEASDFAPVRIISIIELILIVIMQIVFSKRMAEAFGKGKGFAVGLFLLYPIFALILGFGKAIYGGLSPELEKIPSIVGTWKCGDCGFENLASKAYCQNCGAQKR